MSARSTGALILGLILIAAGALFLAVNLAVFNISWIAAVKIVFPALFIYYGLTKLIRHFTWSEEKIYQKPGKTSPLSGIFWFGLGMVLFLDILGSVETLEFLGKYWPVALIFFGLLKIFDHYRFKGTLQVRTGEVFGVVFLIFFGLGAGQLAKAHFPLFDELHLGGFNWPVMFPGDEKKYHFDAEETLPAGEIESVEVTNLYGDLNVIPVAGDSIEIHMTKVVRGETEQDAQGIADSVKIVTRQENGVLHVRTNREELDQKGRKLNTHFTFHLPEDLPIVLKNRYGDISVSKRSAACRIENTYGMVKARSITGDLFISNRYRPVEVKSIQGNLEIKNRRGSIRLEDITGKTKAATDYETITANGIDGDADLRNHFGTIRAEDIKGTLQIEGPGSRIDIRRVTKPVTIKNSHKAVSVKELEGQLSLETSYSKVTLERIRGRVVLQAGNSDISATELHGGFKLDGLGSSVSLNRIEGPIVVTTTLRLVRINRLSGPAEVRNEYGKILLESDSTLKEPVSIVNAYGEIDLVLSASAGAQISAKASPGTIESDVGEVHSSPDENTSSLNIRVGGGGPLIELETSHSNIRIKKRG